VPRPKPHEILVQIVSATLCHSDFLAFSATYSDKPQTMGHEATALVVEPGSDVKGFKPGDKVGFLCVVDCCFECDACRTW
jgi:D-arabinose 1-dehydrogenase-like Zn-dependent alcohol dehydrogenase